MVLQTIPLRVRVLGILEGVLLKKEKRKSHSYSGG
jgi:hypothetical protein